MENEPFARQCNYYTTVTLESSGEKANISCTKRADSPQWDGYKLAALISIFPLLEMRELGSVERLYPGGVQGHPGKGDDCISFF